MFCQLADGDDGFKSQFGVLFAKQIQLLEHGHRLALRGLAH